MITKDERFAREMESLEHELDVGDITYAEFKRLRRQLVLDYED